jgi:hypothetical protein
MSWGRENANIRELHILLEPGYDDDTRGGEGGGGGQDLRG